MSDLAGSLLDNEEGKLRAKVQEQKTTIGVLRKAHGELTTENEKLKKIAQFSTTPMKTPRFLTAKPSAKAHTALLGTTLSDMHFDEVVLPDEIHGLNAYNRDIAQLRLERYYQKLVTIAKHHWTGASYTGIIAGLGGDSLSGDIHELKETNDDASLSGMFYWAEQIAGGYEYLLSEFPSIPIYVPCIFGNHGRLTDRPVAKRAARNNLDWGIFQLLARHFKDNDRITFDITEGMGVRFNMHNVRVLYSHGDVPRSNGGGGIGGIWPTIKRNRARVMDQWRHDPFDYWMIHHYHTYIPFADGLAVNGSTKGPDEWSMRMGFAPEQAQQAAWTITPEQGITFQAALHLTDRKLEGW